VADVHAPSEMAVHCPDCDGPVIGKPHGYTTSYDPKNGPPERWTLLQCPEGHTMLVLQAEYSGMEFDEDTPYRMYPRQDRRLSNDIPEPLREAHDEARKCFHAKGYTAVVAMCGRTLEGACELQGVKERTLQKSLDKMKANGLIDGRLAEWADQLRGVRNSAAHFNSDPITRQDAEDSIAFSEALLDYLYVLTARFNAMKMRRVPGSEA
jgi:hypothetical protein